jgi:hypothetical protein
MSPRYNDLDCTAHLQGTLTQKKKSTRHDHNRLFRSQVKRGPSNMHRIRTKERRGKRVSLMIGPYLSNSRTRTLRYDVLTGWSTAQHWRKCCHVINTALTTTALRAARRMRRLHNCKTSWNLKSHASCREHRSLYLLVVAKSDRPCRWADNVQTPNCYTARHISLTTTLGGLSAPVPRLAFPISLSLGVPPSLPAFLTSID